MPTMHPPKIPGNTAAKSCLQFSSGQVEFSSSSSILHARHVPGDHHLADEGKNQFFNSVIYNTSPHEGE